MATVGSNLGGILIKHATGRITSTMRAAFRMLNVGTDGTQEATKFINTDTNINQGIAKVSALHVGASAGEIQVNATALEINQHADVSARGLSLITTKSVEASDDNKIFFLNLAAGFTVTMPKIAEVYSGWSCKFLVGIAPTTAYIITEDASVDTNTIVGALDTAVVLSGTPSDTITAGTFVTFAANQAIVGDWCIFETDGTKWYVYGQSNVLIGLTLT